MTRGDGMMLDTEGVGDQKLNKDDAGDRRPSEEDTLTSHLDSLIYNLFNPTWLPFSQ